MLVEDRAVLIVTTDEVTVTLREIEWKKVPLVALMFTM